VPLHSLLSKEAHLANMKMPIFMAHGTFDDIIPLSMAEKSRNLLQSCQYSVTWHQYNMAHSLCEQEIIDIESFLTQVLS